MKIFYHLDNDGKLAAWIINAAIKEPNTEFIKMNYGFAIPFDTIKSGEAVYIVDFSFSVDDMHKLLQITNNVIWIDHHKTAIEKLSDFSNIAGIRNINYAGCVLTYMYAFDVDYDEVPDFIKYVGDQDIWKFQYGDTTRLFVAGLYTEETEPWAPDNIWSSIWNGIIGVNDVIKSGNFYLKYKKKYFKEMVTSKGFPAKFEGLTVYALNVAPGFGNSSSFDDLPDVEKYDALIIFGFSGTCYNYTIYSSKMDISAIATKYGGGGHAGAAGFKSDSLLLKRVEE